MNYELWFLDDARRAQHACEADIETESIAISWMRIVGERWARHYDWVTVELWCKGRLVARVPTPMFDESSVRTHQQAATAITQKLYF